MGVLLMPNMPSNHQAAWQQQIDNLNPGILTITGDVVSNSQDKLRSIIQTQKPVFVFLVDAESQDIETLKATSVFLWQLILEIIPNSHAPVVVGLEGLRESERRNYRRGLAGPGIICFDESPEKFRMRQRGHIITLEQ